LIAPGRPVRGLFERKEYIDPASGQQRTAVEVGTSPNQSLLQKTAASLDKSRWWP